MEISKEEIVKSEEVIEETRVEKKGYSIRFFISLAFSFIGIGLLIFLNSKLRTIINTHEGSTNPNALYDNYFFDGIYSIFADNWSLEYTTLNTGFYIVMPIILVLLFLSGSTILAKDTREARIQIFINWFLYIACAITTFLFYLVKKDDDTIWLQGNPFLWYFAMVPFYFMLALQISLLVEKRTFLRWLTFWKEEEPEYEGVIIIILRAINLLFMFAIIANYAWIPFFMGIAKFENVEARRYLFQVPPILTITFMLLWLLIKLIVNIIKKRR